MGNFCVKRSSKNSNQPNERHSYIAPPPYAPNENTLPEYNRLKSPNSKNQKSIVPQIGDRVISGWKGWQYFKSKVIGYDAEMMQYHIEWDDKDETGRNPLFNQVALDQVPDESRIKIGTNVLFEQGKYTLQSTGESGYRWHWGKITDVKISYDGKTTYSGRHLKGCADGKFVTYRDYEEIFTNYKIDRLRVFPTAGEMVAELNSNGPV